ncbi:GIY-YIG nuclease family protein [Flavobacterium sp. 22076]|uniref:GIY-YIG nuclease family protein n=1 Tax=unclassified Flavobacterium TaxID=196869 RepID=UPI003F874097
MKPGFVYIITNKYQTVVYVGVTSNLPKRILEHKNKKYPKSFSAKYSLNIWSTTSNFNGLKMQLQEKNK